MYAVLEQWETISPLRAFLSTTSGRLVASLVRNILNQSSHWQTNVYLGILWKIVKIPVFKIRV
jgi:hypothetical protein